MSDRRMTVHEVADLTGITIRTLHYYDEIGLLKPTMVTDSKYRLYTDDDLNRLQEILFFREVGFALKEIKSLLSSPNYDRTEALKRHLDILQAQKERIDALISLVKTEIEGNPVPSFAPFSETKVLELKEKYRSEVLERWGDTDSFKEYESIFSSKSRRSQTEQMLGGRKTVICEFLGTGMISVMPVPLLSVHPRECSPQGHIRYVPSVCACRWTYPVPPHKPLLQAL